MPVAPSVSMFHSHSSYIIFFAKSDKHSCTHIKILHSRREVRRRGLPPRGERRRAGWPDGVSPAHSYFGRARHEVASWLKGRVRVGRGDGSVDYWACRFRFVVGCGAWRTRPAAVWTRGVNRHSQTPPPVAKASMEMLSNVYLILNFVCG